MSKVDQIEDDVYDTYEIEDQLDEETIKQNRISNLKKSEQIRNMMLQNSQKFLNESTSDNETTCEICCAESNQNNLFSCKNCEFISCLDCQKQLISDSMIEAHCVNCKNYFTLEFMKSVFSKSYLTIDYANHRKKILYEIFIEKNRMLYARFSEKYLIIHPKLKELEDIEKNLTDQISQLGSVSSEYHLAFGSLSTATWFKRTSEKIMHKNKIKYYTDLKKIVREQVLSLNRQLDVIKRHNIEQQPKEITVNEEIIRCYNNECPAILNSDFYCSMCNKKYCPNCEEICENEHSCNYETVKTIKLLNKDSKKCPKCGIKIYRISGCSHMFCTSCKTPFDWTSLKILSMVNFHNPHFNEMLNQGLILFNRNENQEVQENRCIEKYTWQQIINKVNDSHYIKSVMDINGNLAYLMNETRNEYFTKCIKESIKMKLDHPYAPESLDECLVYFQELINKINHLRTNDIITIFSPKTEEQKNKKEIDMFVKLILEKYPVSLIKTELLKFENLNNKRREINYALNLLFNECDNITIQIYEMFDHTNTNIVEEAKQIVNKIHTIINCVNEMFKNISNIYGGVVPYIFVNSLIVVNVSFNRDYEFQTCVIDTKVNSEELRLINRHLVTYRDLGYD